MNSKGVSGTTLDWAPWQQLANQVQQIRKTITDDAQPTERQPDRTQRGAPEPTALTKRMQAVLADHQNLVDASPDTLEDAARVALTLDAINAPLQLLVRGLKDLEPVDYSWHRFPRIFHQLETVTDLRDALDAAGDALSSFPKAQLDALEEALRAELAAIEEVHGNAVESITTTRMPPERVLQAEALEIFRGLQDVVSTLETNTPHELFTDVARRSYGDDRPLDYLRQAASGAAGRAFGFPAVVLPKLAGLAMKAGEPVSSAGLIKALYEHLPDVAPWGDIVHAYVTAAHPDVEIERRPRGKSAAARLAPCAFKVWDLLKRSEVIGTALREAGGDDLLVEASEARDGRGLTGEEVLEIAQKLAGREPQVVRALNSIALNSGLDPIAGMPSEILALRTATLTAVARAQDAVVEMNGKLGHLATTIVARRQDVRSASHTARRAIGAAKTEDVPGIVRDAQGVFEAASEDASAHRRELAEIVGSVVESVEYFRDDLRSKQASLRLSLAPLLGASDASGTKAPHLGRFEASIVAKVSAAERLLDEVTNGRHTSHVRSTLRALESEIEDAHVSVLRLGARTTKTAEVHAEHLAATKAAEERRAGITAEPLTIRRLLELPLEDLRAYRLPSDVILAVTRVRGMGLLPQLAEKVMSGWLHLDDGEVRVRDKLTAVAGALNQISNIIDRVGMGVSPKQAADWLRGNKGVLLDVQTSAFDRRTIEGLIEGHIRGLQKMSER